jgi:mannose-6-phosphate isomerase-like protein (cupin superfamily)
MLDRETKVVDMAEAATTSLEYDNRPVAEVNDHFVRISIMTQPFYWHYHPNSDETFLVLEGRLGVDFEHESLEIGPGQLLTVKRGIPHCTRPIGGRSVNLTFERADATTVAVEAPTRSGN